MTKDTIPSHEQLEQTASELYYRSIWCGDYGMLGECANILRWLRASSAHSRDPERLTDLGFMLDVADFVAAQTSVCRDDGLIGYMSSKAAFSWKVVRGIRKAILDTRRNQSDRALARAANTQGCAMSVLAQDALDIEMAKGSLDVLREALRLIPRDERPSEWVRTQYNLGLALQATGVFSAESTPYEEALMCFSEAHLFCDQASSPLQWARIQVEIGCCLFRISLPANDIDLARKSSNAYRAALADANALPQKERANAFARLGRVLSTIGEQSKSLNFLQLSLDAFDRADHIYRAEPLDVPIQFERLAVIRTLAELAPEGDWGAMIGEAKELAIDEVRLHYLAGSLGGTPESSGQDHQMAVLH